MNNPSNEYINDCADFFLNYIGEYRDKETERRFSSYLKEYDENNKSKTYNNNYKEKINEILET